MHHWPIGLVFAYMSGTVFLQEFVNITVLVFLGPCLKKMARKIRFAALKALENVLSGAANRTFLAIFV